MTQFKTHSKVRKYSKVSLTLVRTNHCMKFFKRLLQFKKSFMFGITILIIVVVFQNCSGGFQALGEKTASGNPSSVILTTDSGLSASSKAVVESYIDQKTVNLSAPETDSAPTGSSVSSKAIAESPSQPTETFSYNQPCAKGGTTAVNITLGPLATDPNTQTLTSSATFNECHDLDFYNFENTKNGNMTTTIQSNSVTNPKTMIMNMTENIRLQFSSTGTVACNMDYQRVMNHNAAVQIQATAQPGVDQMAMTANGKIEVNIYSSDQTNIPAGTRISEDGNLTMTGLHNNSTKESSWNITYQSQLQINSQIIPVSGTATLQQNPCASNSNYETSYNIQSTYTLLGATHTIVYQRDCNGSITYTKDGQAITKQEMQSRYLCLQWYD